MTDATVTIINDFLASPFLVSAGPSKSAAAAAAVPGVPINTAVIEPAYIDPTYTPSNALKAIAGSKPKVSGINKANPIVAVSPGNAPNTIPNKPPTKHTTIPIGDNAT